MKWEPLEVTNNEGERVVIKDYRFEPGLHSDPKRVGEVVAVAPAEEPVEESPIPQGGDVAEEAPQEYAEIEVEVESPVSQGEDVYSCVPCDKDFSREQDLKSHMTRSHAEG